MTRRLWTAYAILFTLVLIAAAVIVIASPNGTPASPSVHLDNSPCVSAPAPCSPLEPFGATK